MMLLVQRSSLLGHPRHWPPVFIQVSDLRDAAWLSKTSSLRLRMNCIARAVNGEGSVTITRSKWGVIEIRPGGTSAYCLILETGSSRILFQIRNEHGTMHEYLLDEISCDGYVTVTITVLLL